MPPSPEDLAEVERMLRRQRQQIDRLELAQRRRLYRILQTARKDLRDRLDTVAADTFSAQHYRVALARVQEGIGALQQDMAGRLAEASADAYVLANRHLAEQIALFARTFEGTVRATSWQPVLAVDDAVLLSRHKASAQTYGAGLIGRIQQELAAGLAQELPWADLERRIAGLNGMLGQDYAGMNSAHTHRQSRAERIVRTEMAYAYNRAHHEDLLRANEADPGYQKTLVSTFDTRTAADSLPPTHGQVRELKELFRDNAGREYPHPPARPNDREVEVPTRPEWREA
ncbi:MAG: hypothetical protein Q8R92_21040 [Deltaproteobacteria bacterium]|nr:hypothetical protein [Deltaproteobacteria bacterium]